MRDGGQLTLGICGESRALGQVLAQQAIGLLVGSTLPGAVRIDNAHLEREAVRHPLRLRQLFPPIIGQRFLQWGRDMPKRLREVLVRPRGIRPVHASQQDQVGRPFQQGAHDRTVQRFLEAIVLPVPRHCTIGRVGPSHAPGVDGSCASAAGPPTIQSARHHVAAPTAPPGWFQQTAACSCRPDTGAADVPQSARASSPPSGVSRQTATTMGHGVFEGAVGGELEYLRGAAPYRPGRDSRVSGSE